MKIRQNLAVMAAASSLWLGMPAAVHAAPITAGNDLLVNFDFTSTTAVLPFTGLNLAFTYSGFNAGEQVTISRFGDLNGTGLGLGSSTRSSNGSTTLSIPAPGLLDGVFSLIFSLNTGDVSIDLVRAIGTTDLGGGSSRQVQSDGVLIPVSVAAVPEPSSILLLGAALAALAVQRRKNRAR